MPNNSENTGLQVCLSSNHGSLKITFIIYSRCLMLIFIGVF